MRFTTAFVGVSLAAAFTSPRRRQVISRAQQHQHQRQKLLDPLSLSPFVGKEALMIHVLFAQEDFNDFLIAKSAPLLLDYLVHYPDELMKHQPPSVSATTTTTTTQQLLLDPAVVAKLALLQQNYKTLLSSSSSTVRSSLDAMVERTTAATAWNLDAYGPWSVAIVCLFLAATQRKAGREEARQELIDKIVSGEINIQEVSFGWWLNYDSLP